MMRVPFSCTSSPHVLGPKRSRARSPRGGVFRMEPGRWSVLTTELAPKSSRVWRTTASALTSCCTTLKLGKWPWIAIGEEPNPRN